ncbi:hypothetical protein GX441_12210 [bacterium]|nr:hypothetical protein [bacterium]
MKKILLAATILALVLGASTLAAQNTSWKGTYWGDPTGIDIHGNWKGIIIDDPTGPDAPEFRGRWISDNGVDYGKLYATLSSDGGGIYKVIKGVIYDKKGLVAGTWTGIFNLIVSEPGQAEGEWILTNDPAAIHHGFWSGTQIIPYEE